MPAYHDCKFSVSGAQAYFSNLNPIAAKIARDVNDTKSTYGSLWYTLTPSEQDEIINETLIRPEITIKYYENVTTTSLTTSSTTTSSSSTSTFRTKGNANMVTTTTTQAPVSKSAAATQNSSEFCLQSYVYDLRNLRNFNQLTIASKLVQDDNFGVYRDEHSAPFSYRTRSQINLTLFEESTPNNKTEKHTTLIPLNNTHVNILNELTTSVVAGTHNSENNMNCLVSVDDKPPNVGNRNKFKVETSELKRISFSPPKMLPDNYIDTNAAIDFAEDKDKINLKYYFGSRKKLTDSTSSVASTDDELEDKRLCTEKVKLLESDSDIRKGFDFLNNW